MIRYVTPTSRRSAEGTTAAVYDGMRREFGVHAEPIVLHSPVPELLAATWIQCREQLVARGGVPRPVKEAVATAVSSVYRCPAWAPLRRSSSARPAPRSCESPRFRQRTPLR